MEISQISQLKLGCKSLAFVLRLPKLFTFFYNHHVKYEIHTKIFFLNLVSLIKEILFLKICKGLSHYGCEHIWETMARTKEYYNEISKYIYNKY